MKKDCLCGSRAVRKLTALDTHNQRDVCMMYVAEQGPTEKNGIIFFRS